MEQQQQRGGRGRHDGGGGRRRKRPAPKPRTSLTDVYIARNSAFEAQLARAMSLLESKEARVTLHGLGAAINRCINIALQLQEKFAGQLTMSVETDTVGLLDEIASDDLEAPPVVSKRRNSAIHVHLTRPAA
ncbi:hypothetical protein PTSG_07506 [Salpingoeca rosetta]|uniref:Ribonuclease P protein subunit p20 n=1 Tax=Salpingoeca rosetta (strain ATCC 50818 / BSB-021) TaxID=946362 RepID=F2UIX4_SALR5|nr:uncharacterized protein PTSG_07506 [Salpingoeca rosetta]EGD77173.1 hypothetical protein PTSG_07506 [Salpingoeca rosetta]|eukprot:XP_004991012.1 hypothetical protein PTSG_07506 [Salpingoeca rosetta]